MENYKYVTSIFIQDLKIWYHGTSKEGRESSPDKQKMQEDLYFLSWKSQ